MVLVLIALLAGVVIGLVLSKLIFKPKCIGTINVDNSTDTPYLFLELNEPLSISILQSKRVTLEVHIKNYVSQD